MASGNTLAIFLPTDGMPQAVTYAVLDVRGGHWVLDFSGTGDTEILFHGILPSLYSGGGLTVKLWVAFTSAVSGTSNWEVAFERIEATDLDTGSFGTVHNVQISAPATSGVVATGTISFTAGADMDSLVAGEAFRLIIGRDAFGGTGTDDITTDAELLRVMVSET